MSSEPPVLIFSDAGEDFVPPFNLAWHNSHSESAYHIYVRTLQRQKIDADPLVSECQVLARGFGLVSARKMVYGIFHQFNTFDSSNLIG